MASPVLKLASRVSALRPTAVNTILADVREAVARGARPVSLMRGEPDLATPEHIREAAERALRDGRTQYPDNRGEARLREAVALKLARDNGLAYSAETEILVTSGATFGIYAALMAVLDPGDEVLLPDPVYDAYHSPIRLAGAVPRVVPARRDGARFTLDVDSLERSYSPNCRALLLNTPWNPVGTVLSRDELRLIADFAERRDLMLLSDEIYEAIVYDGRRHVSPASLSERARSRTIVINSLSKTYSMTGWRVGYCAAPAEVVRAMLLVLQQSSRGPATFIQDAAAEALTGPQDCVRAMRSEYARRRETVSRELAEWVEAPEGGFFAMADVSRIGVSSDAVRRFLLQEAGVVVAHGGAYGNRGEGLLRVSFAAGGAGLEEGLSRLRRGLEQLAEEVPRRA